MDLDHDACYHAMLARDARFDGRFFVAVRTTGIYCRPICPARPPKAANCLFLPTAAAAQEAGYRACLRCRPESSPNLGAWRGTSATVSRALALIEGGALDEADVGGLADRVGVGERQLRRLFRRHLGAAPITVAQTRRMLLAKQLLHETDLPMTEVALASGFGSIRRFNETFRQLYGRPPLELRRGRTAGDREPGSAITLQLPYRPPYDWRAMRDFLATRAIPGVESVDHRYRRVIEIDGAVGTIEVAPARDCEALAATIRFPRLAALPTIIARIRRVFDLGADRHAIGAQLGRDPVLAPLVAARPGLRVPGAWDGFEIAVRAILGQQVSVAAATRLAGKLVAAYGRSVSVADWPGPASAFPTPDRLVGADIAALGMPRARGAAIAGLAAAAAADPALFHPRATLDETIARLRLLPGIGEWTAQYVAMRAMRESDAFPTGDIALLRALADADGRRPTPAAMLARAEAWRPWRAYAALHLWTADAGEGCRDAIAA
jgi:AraC family transcriptional regulator of adaptative response / DNA-3-methyladenine glycosylase II